MIMLDFERTPIFKEVVKMAPQKKPCNGDVEKIVSGLSDKETNEILDDPIAQKYLRKASNHDD